MNSFEALNSSKDVFFLTLMLSSQGFSRDAPMSVFSVSPPNWPLSVSIDEALLLRLASCDWPAPFPPPPRPLAFTVSVTRMARNRGQAWPAPPRSVSPGQVLGLCSCSGINWCSGAEIEVGQLSPAALSPSLSLPLSLPLSQRFLACFFSCCSQPSQGPSCQSTFITASASSVLL